MRMWLDDVRDPQHHGATGFVWVKTADEAIALFITGEVEFASLDHDLTPEQTNPPDGTIKNDGQKSGYDVVCWLEVNPQHWPTHGVTVHSQNPSGRARMEQVVNKYGGMKKGTL